MLASSRNLCFPDNGASPEHDFKSAPEMMLGGRGELVGNLTPIAWRLRRPMPPMMRRGLPPTWRKLRANCRLVPRRNVAMHLFRTVWPWRALTDSHWALWHLPVVDCDLT